MAMAGSLVAFSKARLILFCLTILVGISISIFSAVFLYQYMHEQMQIRIERSFEQQAENLQLNINNTLQVLSSLGALFYSNKNVTKDVFEKFIRADLQKQNSIVSLAWVPIVTSEKRKSFEATMQLKGSGGSHIYDINSHGLINVPFHQDLYYPVQFLYSKYPTQLFPGFNLGTQFKARKKIEETVERGELLVTDSIRLQKGRPGALIIRAFQPVYSDKENIKDLVKGFVLGEIDIESLMRVVDKKKQSSSIILFDLETKFHEQVLYRNGTATEFHKTINNVSELTSIKELYWTRYFTVGNKKWLIAFIEKKTASLLWLPYLGLFIGVLLTSIVSIYMVLFWNKTRVVNRLKNESEAKSRYIQAISHDLRQPLNIIELNLTNYEQLENDLANQTKINFVNKIRSLTRGLHNMFTSLLDITRLEEGMVVPHFQEVRLLPLLTDLGDEFDLLAADKGLDLRLRCQDVSIYTDVVLLECVLRNLLNNAVKYTDQGKIFLGARKVDGQVRIYILDTGRGMDEAELSKVVEPYQRGERSGDIDGLGLGLAIVKQTLDILNMDMCFHSEKEKGTSVVISILGN